MKQRQKRANHIMDIIFIIDLCGVYTVEREGLPKGLKVGHAPRNPTRNIGAGGTRRLRGN
jgi:hypothetical protein